MTTKRVIILVLALLLFVPLFNSDYYFESDKGFTYDLLNLASMYENKVNASVLEIGFNIALKNHKDTNWPVIKLSCPPTD